MKSTCIITVRESDPIFKELGIDTLLFCEEIPARRKPSKKDQKKRKKRKGASLFLEGLTAYYFHNYKKAIYFLQKALLLLTRGTAKYNQAEYYLNKARQMGGMAA